MYAIERIFAAASEHGRRVAMVQDGQEYSYHAFYNAIAKARARLAARGVVGGGFAVVVAERICDAWPVALALRERNLTTVVVRDAAEIANFSDLDIGYVVVPIAESRAGLDDRAKAAGAAVICLGDDLYTGAEDDPLGPPPSGAPGGGHIMLTSGTTGLYKKVLVDPAFERANLEEGFNAFAGADGAFVPEPHQVIANLLNFGLWTVAGYSTPIIIWSRGGAVIFDQTADPVRSFAYPGITGGVVTPAFLSQLLRAPPDLVPRNENMQLIVVGGALSMVLAERTKARLTPRVATTLGSTEAGGWALTPIERPEDLVWHKVYPARTLQVVDEDDQPLPPGKLGQLRVLLTNGRTGYYNDPEASAAFFKNGWFYPGDLAVFDAEGRVALHGRITDVINVMGDKHATAPIERALQDRLGVETVCVMSEQGVGHAEVVHVVIETPQPIAADVIAAVASAELRGFPGANFHFVETMPRNGMGKVMRVALRQMLLERKAAA
ncbi:MAG TPA: AMP-binding protein [Caulobacteraceae bacterium]